MPGVHYCLWGKTGKHRWRVLLRSKGGQKHYGGNFTEDELDQAVAAAERLTTPPINGDVWRKIAITLIIRPGAGPRSLDRSMSVIA